MRANGPENRFVIDPIWRGKRVLLVAGGPSLTARDVCRWRSLVDVTAVVNDGVKMVPDADLLWFTDRAWYEMNAATVRAFPGQAATLENYALQSEVSGIWCVHNFGNTGVFHPDRDGVMSGNNSGYALLHFAVHAGATNIVLLGYDCKVGPKGVHWFGDHPAPLNNPDADRLSVWSHRFAQLADVLAARGVLVVNASPDSALTCFPTACAPSA